MMTLQRALLLSESLNANLLWITYLLNFLSVHKFVSSPHFQEPTHLQKEGNKDTEYARDTERHNKDWKTNL
jgi:hypothetical protein